MIKLPSMLWNTRDSRCIFEDFIWRSSTMDQTERLDCYHKLDRRRHLMNPSNDKLTLKCANCGQSVQSDWRVCPSCGEKLPQVRTCSQCGQALDGKWKICPFCGMQPASTQSSGTEIRDSVVKKFHQSQTTENKMLEARISVVAFILSLEIKNQILSHRKWNTKRMSW